MRCQATTHKGKQCKNRAAPGNSLCQVHIRQQAFVFDKDRNDQARELWKGTFLEDPLPDICKEMVCGATTRAGTPCRRKDIYANGRCKLHGGLSTGPKTAQGKKQSSKNLPWYKQKQTS